MDKALYNSAILRLAASIPHSGRLAPPATTAVKSSPVCGSRVTTDVRLAPDGTIAAFAQEVRACALGQAAASILGSAVLGQAPAQLRAAHGALSVWLKGDGPLPVELALDFPDLRLFDPARAHPARHASIALAFDAAASAGEAARACVLLD